MTEETTAIATRIPENILSTVTEDQYLKILTSGQYANLTLGQQAAFLFQHAVRKGMDPWRQPYQFIPDGKGGLKLYATKEAGLQKKEQEGWRCVIKYRGALRLKWTYVVADNKVVEVPSEFDNAIYEVEVDVVDRDGKVLETELGVTELGNKAGMDRQNTILRAVTKAKRRAILAAAGISENDESESQYFVDSSPATPVPPRPRTTAPSVQQSTVSQPIAAVEAVLVSDATPSALPRKVPPATPPVPANGGGLPKA